MADYTNTTAFKTLVALYNLAPHEPLDPWLKLPGETETRFSSAVTSSSSYKATIDEAIAGIFSSHFGSMIADMILQKGILPSILKAWNNGKITAGDINNGNAFNFAPASEIIDFVYPGASTSQRNELIKAIETDLVTPNNLIKATLSVSIYDAKPSAAAILDIAAFLDKQPLISSDAGFIVQYPVPPEAILKDAIDTPNPPQPGDNTTPDLPEANLNLGLTDLETNVLISQYIAAFDRAPDNDGINYWAGRQKEYLAQGLNSGDALVETGKYIYWGGAGNGEDGTSLNNANFVNWSYQNSLGRKADDEGHAYWVGRLDTGSITRGEFLVEFLYAALGHNSNSDAEFLKSRVAVSEFAAQAHVSKHINLKTVLDGVTDTKSAYDAIKAIQMLYGNPISSTSTASISTAYAEDQQLIGIASDEDTLTF